MDGDSGEITQLLRAHGRGEAAAFDQLMPQVYEQLQRLARAQLRRIPRGQTLDTVALVNEAYLQLVDEHGVDWQDRRHFYAIAARAMRRIVVDHARRRFAEKRGGGAPVAAVDPDLVGSAGPAESVLAVHEALDGLAAHNERLVRVVECRFFAGLTEEETAETLDCSLRTVQRDWRRARAWLIKELGEPGEPDV